MKNDKEDPIRWEAFEKETHTYSDGNTVRQEQEKTMSILDELPKKKVKVKKKILPTVLLAVFSALSIGVILGLVTLQMFVNIEQPASGDSISTIVPSDSQSNESITLPSLSGFMIQAGVFSDLTNAEKWQEDYEGKGFPTIIWDRDGQYYLFIGIYSQESEAQSMVEDLREEGIDTFVKPWKTEENQIDLSSDEVKHLKQLEEVWSESLMNKKSELLEEFTIITNEYDSISALGNVPINDNPEQFLLHWLFQYENLGK